MNHRRYLGWCARGAGGSLSPAAKASADVELFGHGPQTRATTALFAIQEAAAAAGVGGTWTEWKEWAKAHRPDLMTAYSAIVAAP